MQENKKSIFLPELAKGLSQPGDEAHQRYVEVVKALETLG